MRHSILPLAAVLAFTAACTDLQKPAPTEAEAAPSAASVQADLAAAPASSGEASTLCAAYRKQLGTSRAALAQAPRDASLQESVETFEAVIADACD